MEITDFPKIPDDIIAGDKADTEHVEACVDASPVWWMPYTQTVGDGKIATRQEAHNIGGTAVTTEEDLTQCVKKYTTAAIGGEPEDELEELNCRIRTGKTYVQTQCVKKEDLLPINAYPVEFKVDNVAKKTNSANLALYSGEILFGDYIVLEDISKSASVTVWGCLNKGIYFKYRNISDVSGGIYNEKTYYSFTPHLKLEMLCDVTNSLQGITESNKTVVIHESVGLSLCRNGVKANTIKEGNSKINDPHFGQGKFTLTIPSAANITYSNIQKFVATLSFTYEKNNSCPYHCRYCYIEYKATKIVELRNKYKTLPGWVNYKTEWNSTTQVGKWHFAQPLSSSQTLNTTCDQAFAFLTDVYYIDLRVKKTQGQSIQEDCLKTLGKEIFRLCSDLTTVILPTGLTKIPEYCFWNCSSLTSIQQQASSASKEMRNLLINKDFGHIDKDGIRYSKIESYQSLAPVKVDTIGSAAFYNCNPNIKLINLSNITTLDESALEYFQVPLIVVSNKITSIPNRCCFGNHALTTFGYLAWTINKIDAYLCRIVIPDSVQSIGSGAFMNCYEQDMIWGSPYRIKYNSDTQQYYLENKQLGSYFVYLPQSVTTIGTNAFKFWYGDMTISGYGTNTNTLDNVQFWYTQIVALFNDLNNANQVNQNTPHRVYYAGSLNQFLNITFGYEWMDKFWTLLCANNSTAYTVINEVIISEDSPNNTCTHWAIDTASGFWNFRQDSITTKIGPNTFSGCVSITKLTLKVGTPIGSAAFKDCMKLNTIEYQASGDISKICSEAFRNCLNLSPNNFNTAHITHIDSLGLYIIGGQTSEGYGYADTFTLQHIKQIGEDGIYIIGQHRNCLYITVKLGASLHFVRKNSLNFDSWNKSHRDNRQFIQSNVYFYNSTPLSDDVDKGLWYVQRFSEMTGGVNSTDFTGRILHGFTDKTQFMNKRTGINYYVPKYCWDAYYKQGCFLYFAQGGNRDTF